MPGIIRFGSYEVDLCAGQLRKRGMKINLRDQAVQILVSLLEHPGEVVTREQLQDRLWSDGTFVDFENNLNSAVSRLREALCDSADRPRYIETLPRRGYRFIASVETENKPVGGPCQTRTRVLVLPFLNLDGDPARELFADAMTDEVITELASVAPTQLAVIARTTAMHYKGTRKEISRIGRELRVEYVMEGALRHEGDNVVVNVQLIQAADQSHLFARRYEAEFRDIFRLQSTIAEDVARRLPLPPDAIRVAADGRKPAGNMAAYTECLNGRAEILKATPEAMTRAKQHFEAAIELDPHCALAFDGLAALYGYLGLWGFLPADETEPLRKFYALRASEVDPKLAEVRAHVAYRPEKFQFAGPYFYNWQEAEREMLQARNLSPNSPLLLVRHASVLIVLGRTEEAVAEAERALELDPLSIEIRFWLIEAMMLGRQFDRALQQSRQLAQMEPASHLPYLVLGQTLLAMQRYDESIAALRKAIKLSGEFPLMFGWLGLAFGLGGHCEDARNVLDRLHVIAGERYVLPTSFAWLHFGLGELDSAFEWMDRAMDRCDEWIHPIKTYPFLDPVRQDPRYRDLLHKMNLV